MHAPVVGAQLQIVEALAEHVAFERAAVRGRRKRRARPAPARVALDRAQEPDERGELGIGHDGSAACPRRDAVVDRASPSCCVVARLEPLRAIGGPISPPLPSAPWQRPQRVSKVRRPAATASWAAAGDEGPRDDGGDPDTHERTRIRIRRAPGLLPAIKLSVDRDRRPGRFLLTGSADLLLLPAVSESLAGRMEVVRLHPLTEAEKARRPGRFLEHLLAGSLRPRISADAPAPLEVVRRVLEGGFPEAVRRPAGRLRQWHRAYVDALDRSRRT